MKCLSLSPPKCFLLFSWKSWPAGLQEDDKGADWGHFCQVWQQWRWEDEQGGIQATDGIKKELKWIQSPNVYSVYHSLHTKPHYLRFNINNENFFFFLSSKNTGVTHYKYIPCLWQPILRPPVRNQHHEIFANMKSHNNWQSMTILSAVYSF